MQSFFPRSKFAYFPLRVCACVFHSSLFTVVITVCICNMCERNICLPLSFCAHSSMKLWIFGNARTFLKMMLLVSNFSCSKCCISCALSLLILKIIQGTWFSLHAFRNTREKRHEGSREFKDFLLESFRQIFSWVPLTCQGIHYFIERIFYLLDSKFRLPVP